jgi:hypothetical protein
MEASMKRHYLSCLSFGCCALFLALALFACPVQAAVHNVLFSSTGVQRIYVDANDNEQVDVGDPYYTAIYDSAQSILIVQGHGSHPTQGDLLPRGTDAYIYQLWGNGWHSFGATEIAQATVNGINYTNINRTILQFDNTVGLPPLQITFEMRDGANSVNYMKVFCNSNDYVFLDFEATLQSTLNNGQYDQLLLSTAWNKNQVVNILVDDPLFQRVVANLGAGNQTAYLRILGILFAGSFLMHDLFLPAEADGGFRVTTDNGEVLFDAPKNPGPNYVAPPLPTYMGGMPPQPGGGAAEGPNYSGKDTDPWSYFCYIRSLGKSTRLVGAEFNRTMVSRFKENKAYPIAAAGFLFAALFAGVVIMRRKGLGKGL